MQQLAATPTTLLLPLLLVISGGLQPRSAEAAFETEMQGSWPLQWDFVELPKPQVAQGRVPLLASLGGDRAVLLDGRGDAFLFLKARNGSPAPGGSTEPAPDDIVYVWRKLQAGRGQLPVGVYRAGGGTRESGSPDDAYAISHLAENRAVLRAVESSDMWVFTLTANEGGRSLGETWWYRGSWEKRSPAGGPGASLVGPMTRLRPNAVLLLGGRSAAFGHDPLETWIFEEDASNRSWWTDRTTDVSPPPRYAHALASLGDGRVVMFGGRSGASGTYTMYNDAWIWSNSSGWSPVDSPGATPSARFNPAMALFADGSSVILYGGFTGSDTSRLHPETWFFTASNGTWEPWTENAPAHAVISSSPWAALATVDHGVVLYGARTLCADIEGSVTSVPQTWGFSRTGFLGRDQGWRQYVENYPQARQGLQVVPLISVGFPLFVQGFCRDFLGFQALEGSASGTARRPTIHAAPIRRPCYGVPVG